VTARKTNAVRLLEAAGIGCELREYELTVEDFTAAAVAAQIGLPASSVFKTLIVDVTGTGPCFAVVPGDADLDLKALAAAVGGRKAHLVPLRDIHAMTGYVRGAVTVLGARKAFPVVADVTIDTPDIIAVSAGTRGLQMLLRGTDYVAVTAATVARIAR
jgi:Cys-tRNA(Pro)/Cys-tRNA(Cys) deacylase